MISGHTELQKQYLSPSPKEAEHVFRTPAKVKSVQSFNTVKVQLPFSSVSVIVIALCITLDRTKYLVDVISKSAISCS